jgi:hypothetical protein
MDSDQARVREVIQDRAEDVEEPADRLTRLRGAVARLDREPSLISAARRFRRRLPETRSSAIRYPPRAAHRWR